ncbi:MAG: hypothetical protein JW984_14215 [Deltaproteobacteria bacterium]|uniref:Uncharacterized protein n=1 Tax=Candidatus Zymogenus saltonus TaxID=2844893 RepID=A0A9D8KI86_9DELT|nr:hypothetical protein [Candidatus Zymogenus saltonus]
MLDEAEKDFRKACSLGSISGCGAAKWKYEDRIEEENKKKNNVEKK